MSHRLVVDVTAGAKRVLAVLAVNEALRSVRCSLPARPR